DNVYESGRKFLFELIQYIAAKDFTKATARKEEPYISFKIHPGHIFVEFNDDGLTKSALENICLPSRNENEGFSRNGLSSVFNSTAKIYIHSGNFSLDLKLTSATGTVRPIWVTPAASMPDTLTSMTVYLLDQGAEEDLHRLKNIILAQFESLEAASLLFLGKIRRMTVEFYENGGRLRQSKQFHKIPTKDNRISIENTITKDGKESNQTQLYHVTVQEVTGGTRGRNVTLAFPLTEEGKPLINTGKQGLFNVFLEIRNMVLGNQFVKVYKQDRLQCVNSVVILPDRMKDENGQPLLELAAKDMVLSTEYPQSVVKIFKDYGAMSFEDEAFMRLLGADMRSLKPKMHQKDVTEEWHSRMARLLLELSERSMWMTSSIKCLSLVPLRSGTWSTILSSPVYFPTTRGIPVPRLLDFRMVAPSASQNPDRYALFKYLGVTERSIEEVRTDVLEKLTLAENIPLKDINSYLRYLYLTHESSDWTLEQQKKVRVPTMNSKLDNPKLESPYWKTVYLPGADHPFSPEVLLASDKSPSLLSHCFLHPYTLENVQIKTESPNMSWKTWLCEFVGVKEYIGVLSHNSESLSDEFHYVLLQSPDRFLDLLKHSWIRQEDKLSKNANIVSEIRNLPAGKLCGVEFMPKLQETWLPLKRLKDMVDSYMENPKEFPFLQISEDDTEDVGSKWNFLSQHFLVGNDDDLDFYLEILSSIQRSCSEPDFMSQFHKLADLYGAINAKFAASSDQARDKEKLRKFFSNSGIAYYDSNTLKWTGSSSCLWDAPPAMLTARTLKFYYRRDDWENGKLINLESFFRGTLGIDNADLDHLVTELNELRKRKCEDPVRLLLMYNFLAEVPSSPDMRTAFESSPLIYISQSRYKGWYKSTEVLWSSSTELCGMGTLKESYESLGEFFQGKLGIKSLSLQILYDQLSQSPQCSPEQMEEAIFVLNDFIRNESSFIDPHPIRNARIFPVRELDGAVALKSMETEFAIGDNDNLRVKFQDKISFLNFDLKKVRRLKPLFNWLRLENRYLSRCIQENTTIIRWGGVFPNSGEKIYSGRRDLSEKARHITRVALSFDSPRCRSGISILYRQLRNMTVSQVIEMSCVLSVHQNGQSFVSEGQPSKAHVAEPDGKLHIYVPINEESQDISFGSVLPRKFAAWLMKDPDTDVDGPVEMEMINAITSIFSSEAASLENTLDNLGMVKVDNEAFDEDEYAAARHKLFLESVVQLARRTDFPSFEAFNVKARERHSQKVLDNREKIALRQEAKYTPSYLSGESKVSADAAAELYVFELLKKLKLPYWDYENWLSPSRNHVASHPEYSDIPKYKATYCFEKFDERTTFAYMDTYGKLTQTLVDRGLLAKEQWGRKRPKYWIQVKSSIIYDKSPFSISELERQHVSKANLVRSESC
ncbi:hypothetical protein IL306_008684, partial [Fusarium sp. DS 682]